MTTTKEDRVYKLRQLVLKPNCFTAVRIPGNETPYYVSGRLLSRSARKGLYDENDVQIFKKTESITSWLGKQYLLDNRNQQVYSLRKRSFFPFFGRDTINVYKGKEEDGGATHFMNIISNPTRTEFTITDVASGARLAKGIRKGFTRRLITGVDLYEVKIFAGADEAMMLMLSVCVDEHYNDLTR